MRKGAASLFFFMLAIISDLQRGRQQPQQDKPTFSVVVAVVVLKRLGYRCSRYREAITP